LYRILIIIIFLFFNSKNSYGQHFGIKSKNLQSRIIDFYSNSQGIDPKFDSTGISLSLVNSIFLNTNLPNLENINGYYFPKGYGSYSSFQFRYNSKFIFFSLEPLFSSVNSYKIDIIEKKDQFSMLNDVQLNQRFSRINNAGLILKYGGISIGYGNWNDWWGPGLHNSLVMSNNSQGFFNFFIENPNYTKVFKNFYGKAKYSISDKFINFLGADFYLSSLSFEGKVSNIKFGYSKNVLSGGYVDLKWSMSDALLTILSKKNMKYWDTISDYYILATFPKSNIELFIEIGVLDRSFLEREPGIYANHNTGSNIGFRKKNIFGIESMLIGSEYTRLVQSIYYNIIPTSNWYDNIKYNFSSFNGRRWAAHSGSDSDDLIFFVGFSSDISSFIYGINYERHGVNHHFPPEVKIETRLSVNYNFNNISISIYYENEYFEHYGFVDSSQNVWNKTFEEGSLQRTKTILFSLGFNL
tara:strand:- start:1583 stop:2989 length:1407 start_codon:yes stop_codon:yes gene_type:complete